MEEQQLDLESLIIAPLERIMVRGAFVIEDPESQHLIDWFKTRSIHSQEERKCKVYVAMNVDTVIGYVCLSMALPETPIEGLTNRTDHQPQMILIGKLYISPEYRSKGLGTKLMEFTLDVAIRVDQMLGCIGLIVDANINPRTVAFYERFGFEELSRTSRVVKMFFKIPSQPVISTEQPELAL